MVVGDQAPNATILSMVTVDGNPGLSAIEPALGTGRRGLIDHPVLWVVRTLEGTRLETYIVIDGSDAIYRMTADGDALPLGGSLAATPRPSQAPGYSIECGPLDQPTCQTQRRGNRRGQCGSKPVEDDRVHQVQGLPVWRLAT